MKKPYHLEIAYENCGQRDRTYYGYVCDDCSRNVLLVRQKVGQITMHGRFTRKQFLDYFWEQLELRGLTGLIKHKDYIFYEV